MKKLIYLEDALFTYTELYDEFEDNKEIHNVFNKVYDKIKELPSAEPEQQWTPVSERLPKENGVYLTSYEDATVLLEWFNGKWFFYPSNPAREETGTILAWMPLPEPYKETVTKCHQCHNSTYDSDFGLWFCDGQEVDPDGSCDASRP